MKEAKLGRVKERHSVSSTGTTENAATLATMLAEQSQARQVDKFAQITHMSPLKNRKPDPAIEIIASSGSLVGLSIFIALKTR
jgi:hypothetical protein